MYHCLHGRQGLRKSQQIPSNIFDSARLHRQNKFLLLLAPYNLRYSPRGYSQVAKCAQSNADHDRFVAENSDCEIGFFSELAEDIAVGDS